MPSVSSSSQSPPRHDERVQGRDNKDRAGECVLYLHKYIQYKLSFHNTISKNDYPDEWAAKYPDRFKAHYILSDAAPEGWEASGHSTGFVGKELFEEVLYPSGDNVYSLMCGPPIMLDRGCTPNLKALGHKEENIFSF